MHKKILKYVIIGLIIIVNLAILMVNLTNEVHADSANPYLQVNCSMPSKTGSGWQWDNDMGKCKLTLNNYDGEEISIGGIDNGSVDIVLVGENKITVTAPYGHKAISAYNISNLAFKGSGSLIIDFKKTASEQVNMYGIYIDGSSSSYNNGNLSFEESCSVTLKVYGEVAENNGSTSAIYMNNSATASGNVTVGESATLNIDLKCDNSYMTYGICAKGNVLLNGTVNILMEYTGTDKPNNSWCDIYTSSMYNNCSIGKKANITSVCPGSTGTSLTAFPLVANDNERITSWTKVLANEQYFENDECIVHAFECGEVAGYQKYSYGVMDTPLTFEDSDSYDVPASIYGGDPVISSIALTASGGSGEYTFSIVSSADGNIRGVGITSENTIYVNPNLRGISDATEITVRVRDKFGYGKEITVNIGAVSAPTYSATIDDIDFGMVRVGYSSQKGVYVAVHNTGTGKIFCNGVSVTLEGENASDYFYLGIDSVPAHINAGGTMTNWYIRPQIDLPVGIYLATIKFKGTPEYLKYGVDTIEVTATVKFVVTEHDFDTSIWEYDDFNHWNPCKDAECSVHGNETSHDTKGEVTGYIEATFNNDGYTGDKHCSVCKAESEKGTIIPAGKYIRVSQATMTPNTITDQLSANDLLFTSLDDSKYTVSLWRVFDLTDTALNTDSGQYPKDSKFIANHEYAIEIEFKAVSPYVYEEMYDTYWSTFSLNGQLIGMSGATSLGGSTLRRFTTVAQDTSIPVEVTEVQIDFESGSTTVIRDGSYTFKAIVTGTGAFDNTVTWSVEGGSVGTSISNDGVLKVDASETASTLIIKAISNGDIEKYATKSLEIYTKVTIIQGTNKEEYYKKDGEIISLTALDAAEGYHFKNWTITGLGIITNENNKNTNFEVSTSNVVIESNYELHDATEETWKSDGTKHWHECTCGEKMNVEPHIPDRAEPTQNDPVMCTICKYIITIALGHTTHVAEETWLSDEDNHWHKCESCNEKMNVEPHSFGEWNITIQPQESIMGEKERECSVCGYKETLPVDALENTITIVVVGGKINNKTTTNVNKNSVVTVVADTAPEGKEFKGWSFDNGQTIASEDETYSFSATENATITAVYSDISSKGEQKLTTGLSGGAIAGIVVGGTVVVGLGGFSLFWFVIKKKKFADIIALFKKK